MMMAMMMKMVTMLMTMTRKWSCLWGHETCEGCAERGVRDACGGGVRRSEMMMTMMMKMVTMTMR